MDFFQYVFSSRKFLAMIFGIIAVIIADILGVSSATLGWITATLGAYLLSQGLADIGKEAEIAKIDEAKDS